MTKNPDEMEAATVRSAIRERGEAIRRRELQRALSRLEAHGGLAPAQRAVVEDMATAIVDAVLAPPDETLRRADGRDGEAVRTAIELFGPGTGSESATGKGVRPESHGDR